MKNWQKQKINIPVINISGQPAIRVNGKIIKKLDKATLIDFDGDQAWIPNGLFIAHKNDTVDIQEWIFKKKFPNG